MPKYANTSTYRRWKRSRSKVMAKPVRRGITKRYGRPKTRMNIKAMVNKVLKSKIETKQSVRAVGDTFELEHNNFKILENQNTFFRTVNGTGDPMIGDGQRIGDEITLKGISFNMMLELNERFSDVTCRLIMIKSAKGDIPTRASLFKGLSGNKMLDQFNTERYTIIASKYIKLKASNTGTTGALASSVVPLVPNYGFNSATDSQTVLSRTTRLVKFWLPGTKFGRNGVLKYEDLSTTQLKFFDYHFLIYAYSNVSTNQDIVSVARVNDYFKVMYYTDA